MDKDELWRIYVSMTAAQRYYYQNRERKKAENLMHYREHREEDCELRVANGVMPMVDCFVLL